MAIANVKKVISIESSTGRGTTYDPARWIRTYIDAETMQVLDTVDDWDAQRACMSTSKVSDDVNGIR